MASGNDLELAIRIVADAADAVKAAGGLLQTFRSFAGETKRLFDRVDAFEQLRQQSVQLGTAVSASRDRVRDLGQQIVSLRTEASAYGQAVAQLRQTDAFSESRQRVVSLSAALEDSRKNLRDLASEIANTTASDTSPLEARYAIARRESRQLERDLLSEQDAYAALAAELQAAGIDTRNLAAEQTRLRNAMSAAQGAGVRADSLESQYKAEVRELNQLTTAATRAEDRLQEMGEALQKDGVDTRTLSAEQAKLADQLSADGFYDGPKDQVLKLQQQLDALAQNLATAYARWEQLEALR